MLMLTMPPNVFRRIGEMNATSLWVASIRPLKQAFHHLFLLMQYFE
jgi:hypothetical protein